MLRELVVRDLGVIDSLSLVLGPGMTALTGETGAGKTLVVEAIELLVGGRADSSMVRHGASEAVVDGRFELDGEEVILRRVVPREGRSRAYIGQSPATVAEVAQLGARLVDLHGQHTHQSLLSAEVQRRALDEFGGIDLEPLEHARARLAEVEAALAARGGDERTRAREMDLLRFQVSEIDSAAIAGPDEDEALEAEEGLLGDALANREAAAGAAAALGSDGGAGELAGVAAGRLAGRSAFTEVADRLEAVLAELADLRSELRSMAERIDEDPDRLSAVRERRQVLAGLRRKYGDTLGEVIEFADQARARLADLEAHDAAVAELEVSRSAAREAVERAEREVGSARRAAAPRLAASVGSKLPELALRGARFDVQVDDEPGGHAGDRVRFLLAANPGSPHAPLTKVASGGELARTMLAVRLVLSQAPGTLVFDEVDAGVGGTAASAVGRALAALAERHQVLVVTHLPQVAACADHHVVVTKSAGRTTTRIAAATACEEDRVVELARMLSGSPGSKTALAHARELLAGLSG